MNKCFFSLILMVALIATVVTSCDKDNKPPEPTTAEVERDAIVTRLNNESELSEFVDALQGLNLSNVQAEELTIFAVNNAGLGKSALKSTGNEELVLQRHVVEGKYLRAELTDSLRMSALDGSTLLVVILDGQIYINGVALGRDISVGNSIAFVVGAAFPTNSPQLGPVTGVGLDSDSIALQAGSKTMLIATVMPGFAADRSVTWSSNADSIATVSPTGEVEAFRPGKAIITVTTNDGGFTASCIVYVPEPQVSVTSISFVPDSMAIYVGDSLNVVQYLNFYPVDASYKAVIWTTSAHSIATVSASGVVEANAPGTAFITATTIDGGHTATFIAYVPAPPIDVNKVKEQLQTAFNAFVQQHYLVDAFITQEAKWDSISRQQLWYFNFTSSDADIAAVWNRGYEVIEAADVLAASNAAADVKNDAAMMRLYAFSTMYNYFRQIPLNRYTGAQMQEQEIIDYIVSEADMLIANSPNSDKFKALTLKARILMNWQQPNLQQALDALLSIANSGEYQIPTGSFLLWGQGWTTPTTEESIWEGIPVGNNLSIKKHDTQTYTYPMRYLETVLLMIECYIRTGNTAQANVWNDILLFAMYGWDEPRNYNLDQLRESCDEIWETLMFREGLRFAYLKRNDLLYDKLNNFQSHKVLLPIPASAITQNPKLLQNPGW